jgi:hypothetical protein
LIFLLGDIRRWDARKDTGRGIAKSCVEVFIE